jgi:hypothetical protein
MKTEDKGQIYRIKVKGRLDNSWSGWFDGLTVANEENETTTLTGKIADQAALHGLIGKIRNLGLPLLLVERVEVKE